MPDENKTSSSSTTTETYVSNIPESKITKVLYNQVSLGVALIAVVFGIYYTFANPQKQSEGTLAQVKLEFASHEKAQALSELALAKQVENLQTGDLKDIRQGMSDQQTAINALTVQIAELKTIINERIPKK
jgi:hypothetical protein